MNKKGIIFILFVSFFMRVFSQEVQLLEEPKTLFGLQFGTILPLNLIQQNSVENSLVDTVSINIGLKASTLVGMEVRHYFNQNISFQSGINITRRNYDFDISSGDSLLNNRMKFLGYEIPAMALVYLRLSKNIYMDNAVGFCANFFPTDISVPHTFGMKTTWIKPSILANVGWEYRTPNNGYIYFGAIYQLHFRRTIRFLYYHGDISGPADRIYDIRGSYFALTLKYFLRPTKQKKH